ncbi:cytochrome P450 [Xylaria cf. heliscus]|nr:cytochrome P450 [Xylaria cf. heliscus]
MFIAEVLRSTFSYGSYILLFYCLALGSYRLVLHPLRQYPGPFLAKITQAYAGFYAVQKRLHLEVYQYHEQYGSVVRVGPNRLVFNTATALKDIYQNDRITKASTYLVTTRNNVFNVFSAIDNNLHSQKRKIIGQALSDRSVRAFEPTILEKLDIALKHIWRASQESTPVDVTQMTRYLALDIIGQLSFGYDLDIQTKEDNRFMMKGMTFGNYRGNVYQHFPLLSKLYIDKIGDKVFYEARERYFRLLEKMVKSRTSQDKNAKHDFYSFVADSFKSTARGGDLWLEAIFFLVAGGDTAATAMCGVFFYLSRYPECYDRLVGEVRSSFTTAEDIKSGPQLSRCMYLRACIDEAMRMSPPVSTTLWREQVRGDTGVPEPLVVDGHVIPPGVLVGVNIYALHHNKEYFPDPFTYKPERWIDTSEEGKEGSKYTYNAAFAPFSVGPRACAGKSLAYLETSLLIAKMLWYFDFKAAPGKLGEVGGGTAGKTNGREREKEYQLDDIFTSRHVGPHLVFTSRESVRNGISDGIM